MKNKDLQTLDLLRGEFEKSVDSAKVPLKLQKQSIVHMLEKDAQERKAQEEAEAKKKYQVVTVKKLIAIAAALIVTVTGTLVMQPGGGPTPVMLNASSSESDGGIKSFKDYNQIFEIPDVKKSMNEGSSTNHGAENPFNGQQPVTPEVSSPVVKPTENHQTTNPAVSESAQNNPPKGTEEQAEVIYQEISETDSENIYGESEELKTNSSEGVARFEEFEADIIKQNGGYLYALTTGTGKNGEHTEIIRIAKIVPGNQMEDVSEITVYANGDNKKIEECIEFFFHGNTLVTISKETKYETEYYDIYRESEDTVAVFYDISDPANPVKIYSHVQNGAYVSARLCDKKLYIVTSADIPELNENTDIESVIPGTRITTVGNSSFTKVSAENIFYDNDDNKSGYSRVFTYVTVTDVSAFSTPVQFAFYGGGKDVSCHADTIVIPKRFIKTDEASDAAEDCTIIYRFNVNGDKISYAKLVTEAEGVIVGGIYVDEKKGNLRMVTKSADGYNVYVFNNQMECVDAVENILSDITVEKVKYISNRVYLVYGENTSIIDFSKKLNAENIVTVPVAISTNLYEVTNSVLLGIGFAGEEKKAVLTLFDFSNPENFTSTDEYELPAGYSFAAGNDGRCIMIDSEKKIFGIPVIRTDAETNNDVSSYLIFSVEGGKITSAGECIHDDAVVGDSAVRCICVGDTVYTVSGNKIVSHSANECKQISELKF